jgi:predicted phosphodiesterase
VLLVNPGSPTFPRNLTRRLGTVALLEIDHGRATARMLQLSAGRGAT